MFADVVVHPLKAYGHFADLRVTEYAEEEKVPPSQRENLSTLQTNIAPEAKQPKQEKEKSGFQQNELGHEAARDTPKEERSKLQELQTDEERSHSKIKRGLKPTVTKVEKNDSKMTITRNKEEEKKTTQNNSKPRDKNINGRETKEMKENVGHETAEEEDESISIMTGRLSLSVTSTSDKGTTNIGVKAQRIETDQLKVHQSPEEDHHLSPSRSKSKKATA